MTSTVKPAPRFRLRRRPEAEVVLGSAIREVVIAGTDERVAVADTTLYPWRCICALRITAADGRRFLGTGWLAGPRTVITAGHCVYMPGGGGWVTTIEVIPASDGLRQPFDSCIAREFRSVAGWIDNGLDAADYGAILLPADFAYGASLGYLGYGAFDNYRLISSRLTLSGYPSDKPLMTQWNDMRVAYSVTPRFIYYEIDTGGGQSGSPVWLTQAGMPHVVGIHTTGSQGGNSALRISGGIYDVVEEWTAEGL